jgi:hypothetical protein
MLHLLEDVVTLRRQVITLFGAVEEKHCLKIFIQAPSSEGTKETA